MISVSSNNSLSIRCVRVVSCVGFFCWFACNEWLEQKMGISHVAARSHNVQFNANAEYKPMRWIWIIKCTSEIKTHRAHINPAKRTPSTHYSHTHNICRRIKCHRVAFVHVDYNSVNWWNLPRSVLAVAISGDAKFVWQSLLARVNFEFSVMHKQIADGIHFRIMRNERCTPSMWTHFPLCFVCQTPLIPFYFSVRIIYSQRRDGFN